MTKRPLPSVEQLGMYLRYDTRTGRLYWRNRKGNQAYRNGTEAGRVMQRSGYRSLSFFGVTYYEHRVVFKILNGYDPDEVDHRDPARKHDNSKTNLRNASPSQNKSNRRGFAKSGYKGVVATSPGRYMALITYNKTQTYLGTYSTPEEAHEAYAIMAHILYGEFANTSHKGRAL